MLELSGVSKRYGDTPALHRTDLQVERGRTTVLIGPSGCGKSTLIRLMLGLLEPDTGTVRFLGERLAPQNVLAIRRRIGYVVQNGALFPHYTAHQNVTVVARYLGWPRARIGARVAELLQLTGLPEPLLPRYPAELSGGQYQRVALMRALLLDPELLLLDEPLGALDPMIRFDLQGELKRIFERLDKTVVLVTHDLAEAAFFADRVVLLRAGRIVQQGDIADLIRQPADDFVQRFIRAQRAPLDALQRS